MSTKKWPRYDEIKSETLLAKRCVVVKRFARSVCPCNSSPRYFAAFLLNSDTVFLFPFVRVHILCFPSSYLILSSTKNPIVPSFSPLSFLLSSPRNLFALLFPPYLFDFVRVSAHLFPCIIPTTYYTNTRRKRRGFDASFLVYTVSRIVLRTRPEIRPRRAMYHLIDSKLRVTVSNHCLASCIHPLPSFSVVFSSTRRSWINLFHLLSSPDEWGPGVWLPS